MEAGELRHRLSIEHAVETRDPVGGTVETWSEFAAVWGAIEPLQGREFFQGSQLKAEVDHRVRVRYLPGVTDEMRVVFGARRFDIKAVLNLEERRRELHLMCQERV